MRKVRVRRTERLRTPAALLSGIGVVSALVAVACADMSDQGGPSGQGRQSNQSSQGGQPGAGRSPTASAGETTGPSRPARTPSATPGRTPSASATPSRRADGPSDPRTPSVVTVTIAGDVMLGRRVGDRLAHTGDFADALRPTARRLAAADITVGNLESTLSQLGPPMQGGDSFGADPRVRSGLRLAGFDVLSLANNHAGDYGSGALVETVRLLRAGGHTTVGAGANRWEAWRPAVVTRHGIRVGFLAFNAIGETRRAGWNSPGAASVSMQPRTGPLDRDDLAYVTSAVRKLARRADVVIVLPHWGDQYTHQPVPDQRTVGRALIDAGADAVVGGHPHWVQSAELHRGRPLVHSLGNFVFDMDWEPEVREGVVLELRFTGDRLASTRFLPYVIGSDFAPRWVYGERADQILADLRLPDRGPYRIE
jgi:poly-gamma-glutamate capsule biosynthesis protein CapA/YwtB (metallophosphatase superfamily)